MHCQLRVLETCRIEVTRLARMVCCRREGVSVPVLAERWMRVQDWLQWIFFCLLP